MSVCLCPLLNLFLSLGFLCLVELPAMVSPPVAVAALHWTCLPVALSTPHDTMEHPGLFHSNIWVQIFSKDSGVFTLLCLSKFMSMLVVGYSTRSSLQECSSNE